MGRAITPKEIDVLTMFVDEMEAQGASRKRIRLTVDANFAERLGQKLNVPVTLELVQKLTDQCLANEWLEGGGKYGMLMITTTGFGVVRSKQKSEELKRSRSGLKRLSDIIEDHKGLFIALGALSASLTLDFRLTP